jgi:hypothetical protein
MPEQTQALRRIVADNIEDRFYGLHLITVQMNVDEKSTIVDFATSH